MRRHPGPELNQDAGFGCTHIHPCRGRVGREYVRNAVSYPEYVSEIRSDKISGKIFSDFEKVWAQISEVVRGFREDLLQAVIDFFNIRGLCEALVLAYGFGKYGRKYGGLP